MIPFFIFGFVCPLNLPMQASILVKYFKQVAIVLVFTTLLQPVCAQQKTLSLKAAIQTALSGYGGILAKKNLVNYYKNNVKTQRSYQLPDLSFSAQQDYGTVNSQSGPSYAYRGLNVSSSGPYSAKQNWNAGFGALYLANINWDIFAFGRVRNLVRISGRQLEQAQADLDQEEFQDEIKVASGYLNLLASVQLAKAQESNLRRATAIQNVVRSRVLAGLNPGVDSALAGAQVSSARIDLTNALENQAEQSGNLATAMGSDTRNYDLDTIFIKKIPAQVDSATAATLSPDHPVLLYYQKGIRINDVQVKYLRSLQYPTLSLFSVFQEKASGFSSSYTNQNLNAYTSNYFKGVDPMVGNYLIGVGVIWNITNIFRTGHQVDAQKAAGAALQNSYDQVQNQLNNQLILSAQRIKNAWRNYKEAPVELKAAQDAYLQKSVLYTNGLATIVDLSTALYALNRAETDQEIAYNNIWQALLYRAAARGDFRAFYNLL